jgi:hypothetical protein
MGVGNGYGGGKQCEKGFGRSVRRLTFLNVRIGCLDAKNTAGRRGVHSLV